MKYHYATETAAGACPGCGQPLILYRHVHLTSGPERHDSTLLDTIFCRVCAERMLTAGESLASGSNCLTATLQRR